MIKVPNIRGNKYINEIFAKHAIEETALHYNQYGVTDNLVAFPDIFKAYMNTTSGGIRFAMFIYKNKKPAVFFHRNIEQLMYLIYVGRSSVVV